MAFFIYRRIEMAQTTYQVPMACGKLEISPDCQEASYIDISGVSQSVAGTEQGRMSGEAYTFEGDTALIAGGKREPLELEFVIVYTETDAEAYEQVRAIFESAYSLKKEGPLVASRRRCRRGANHHGRGYCHFVYLSADGCQRGRAYLGWFHAKNW